jgi:16S rRNA (guanine1516-N2)-methyltransferase
MIQCGRLKGNQQKNHRVIIKSMSERTITIPLWGAPGTPLLRTETLARDLGLSRVDAPPTEGPLVRLTEERLEFCTLGDPDLSGALWVDFTDTHAQRRSRASARELLIRAARIRGVDHPLLIDATAGLGRDGFLLAAHGFRVVMIEANPVVAALLDDGLRRARHLPRLEAVLARIRLFVGNSLELLPQLDEQPAVIYLDPMFPQRTKSAKVKQDLRLLQLLDRHDLAPEPLLAAALAIGANKVVVKRPLKGPFLGGIAPGHCLKGKAIRFDVYPGPGKKESPVQIV